MTKRTALIVFALTLILPFAQPRRAEAVTWDTLTTYYTGSCTNLSYNGYRWRECDGTVTQSGTLSGTWRCDDTYDCIDGGFVYYWYEYCNNSWVFRYSVSGSNRMPTSTDCQCT